MMSITTLGENAIITSAVIKARTVVDETIQRISRDAVEKLIHLKIDYFSKLQQRSDLKGALKSLFSDRRCLEFRPIEDLAKLTELVDKDVITKGTRVVRIDNVSDNNPRTYLVLSEQGRKYIRIQVDSSDEPDGRLQHKSTFISESLFGQLTSVFGDVVNQHVNKFTEVEFSALEKAIEQKKSVFKRVLSFATSLLFRKEGLNGKEQLDTHVRDFNFDLILETFQMNKSAEIPETVFASEKRVIVVDPMRRCIQRYVYINNKSDKGWNATEFLSGPRGTESITSSFTITKDMFVFDPIVAYEIEEKVKQTLKSASMRFVNQLAWSIRHR